MSDTEPLVFARPTPTWFKIIVVLWPLVAGLSMVAFIGLLTEQAMPGGGPLDAFSIFGLGEVPLIGTGAALVLLVVFAAPVLMILSRRRYGRCTIQADQASFELAFTPGRAKWVSPDVVPAEQVVPLAEIAEAWATPAGVLVRAPGRGRWREMMFPLFIPTSSEEETSRALEAIHTITAEGGADEREATFGCLRRPLRATLVESALSLLLMGIPMAIAAARFGTFGLAVWSLLGIATVVPATWLVVVALRPRYRRVHVGREALVLDERRIPWEELTAVGGAESWLALEEGRRRHLAHLGEDLPAALERIRARVVEHGRELSVAEALPPWATAPARRRRTVLAAGSCLLVLALLVAGALADPNVFDTVHAHDGVHSVRLVYRLSDEQPRLLAVGVEPRFSGAAVRYGSLIVPGLWTQQLSRREDGVALDFASGRGRDASGREFAIPEGTTLHLFDGATGASEAGAPSFPAGLTAALRSADDVWNPGARMVSAAEQATSSLPALLAQHMGEAPDDPALRRFIEGRTSFRCQEAVGADGLRLVWGAALGRVSFVLVAPASRGLNLQVSGALDHVIGAGSREVFDFTGSVRRLFPDGRERVAEPRLPDFDALLEATRRIRAGEPVAEAAGPLLPGLF